MLELDLPLLAGAYEGGEFIGRVIRWVVLLAVGVTLVRRLVSGSFGPGFTRSRLVTILGLGLVLAGVIGSVRYDFPSPADKLSERGAKLVVARAEIEDGCRSHGARPSLCVCYASAILDGAGHDPERLETLGRELEASRVARQSPPAVIQRAAQDCAARQTPGG